MPTNLLDAIGAVVHGSVLYPAPTPELASDALGLYACPVNGAPVLHEIPVIREGLDAWEDEDGNNKGRRSSPSSFTDAIFINKNKLEWHVINNNNLLSHQVGWK